MRLIISILVVCFFVFSCRTEAEKINSFLSINNNNLNISRVNNKELFIEIDSCYSTNKIIIPEGFSLQVLFSELNSKILRKDGNSFPSKGLHDMISYIPKDGVSSNAWLYVGHETMGANNNLGDGGGGTIFEIKKNNSKWEVISDYFHIILPLLGPGTWAWAPKRRRAAPGPGRCRRFWAWARIPAPSFPRPAPGGHMLMAIPLLS